MIKITECPRDAMQGIKDMIPTDVKVEYLNQLLKVGFEKLDFGSFVSPKAIPQMHDTAKVLDALDLSSGNTQLLAIIANARGAQDACAFAEIDYLGFPFSISETFQQRNTNSSIEESLMRVEEIQRLCVRNKKKLLVYISMAFGNPYGDKWHPEITLDWCLKLKSMGVKHMALADTIGSSNPETISHLFGTILPELNGVALGAHLHATADQSAAKIKAAYDSGCRLFDVAMHGFGGCPMAADELTGNVATEILVQFMKDHGIHFDLKEKELTKALVDSSAVFGRYH
jgi:hydroxymethylglutaryl-CoA lyase